MTAEPAARRLRVNPVACQAHGVCAELLPELIDSDPWGYPVVAERAVEACPALALLLTESGSAARH